MRRVATQEMETLRALVGSTLDGRLRLDELIALGGMGAVFRARHLSLDKNLAVKVLHPQLASDGNSLERFDREAEAASRLDHPHCVRVDDYGRTNLGLAYIVMELLEGTELSSRLGKPLAPERAVELITQILAGLGHAHGKGVVHRDVKPDNVFVTVGAGGEGRERLKLVDFGIAKLLEHEETWAKLTQAGFVFGTPLYMSPEQARGRPLDGRADLYATGLILYEMLAGWPPFHGTDSTEVLRKQVEASHEPLPEETPAGLREVVDRLLQKAPDDRYQNAQEVLDTLGRLGPALKDVKPAPSRPPSLDRPAPSSPAPGLPAAVSGEDDVTVPARLSLPSGPRVPPVVPSMVEPGSKLRPRAGWGLPVLVVVAGFLGVGAYLASGGSANPGDTAAASAGPAEGAVSADPKLETRKPVRRTPQRDRAKRSDLDALPAPPEPTAPPETVAVRITTPGVDADVLDPVDGGSYGRTNTSRGVAIPRSKRPIRLRLSAPGHTDLEFDLVPDADMDLQKVLERAQVENNGPPPWPAGADPFPKGRPNPAGRSKAQPAAVKEPQRPGGGDPGQPQP